jgi:biotin carboxyl carrier protein
MINVRELLEEIKASPYKKIEVVAPHTGIIEFVVTEPGVAVVGPSGNWKEKPGTLLAKIDRERNVKPICAPEKGEVEKIESQRAGKFVEAGTPLMTIRHHLTRKEVIDIILKKTLHLYRAPERAKYYFVPEIDKKLRSSGKMSVGVHDGMDLFIMSRMKRETGLSYSGPEGQIYAVYFKHNQNVDSGEPLIGVCPADQLSMIQEVVARVRSEWEENE